MKWSKMTNNGSYISRKIIGGITYTYAKETSLYQDDILPKHWNSNRLGFIERWRCTESWMDHHSVYNAWVCYGEKDWVDLGWYDFDPSVADEQMNAFSSLKELKKFVKDQHQLLNEGGS